LPSPHPQLAADAIIDRDRELATKSGALAA
jgi:hypothetical protein